MFVEGDGKAYLAHPLDTRVWHSGAVVSGKARNLTHVGICYAGNVAPNQAQLAALNECVAWVKKQLGRALSLEGHKDAYPTSCPGALWPQWKSSLE